MNRFVLSCESTVDMPYSYLSARDIPVAFYSYWVDGREYPDDMLRDPEALPRFYSFLENGKLPFTSQLNEYAYTQYFESLSDRGDLLHIAFGSGMTKSVQNAQRAADALNEANTDRKIVVIDSLCSSSGYGMLVDYAADLRDNGCEMDEIISWVMAHRTKIHHQFFSHQLDYYRRSGRISGPAATLATILNICPIMRLDDEGKIIAYDKVRGKRAAIRRTIDTMEQHAVGGASYNGKCFICHSDCLDEAIMTRAAVMQRFPDISGDIRIFNIGTIIASHCGPGTVAVFFLGDDRPPMA